MNEAGEQISSYLLGELDVAEAAAFERRMSSEPELREEVERLRPLVARLEGLPPEVWEPAEPPPLAMPEDAGAPPAAAPVSRRRWLRLPTLTLSGGPAAALAVTLLAIGVVAGLLIGGDGSEPTGGTDLALSRIDDGPPGAGGEVRLATDDSRATIEVDGLDPSGADRFYEIWLLDDDGRMIALGSFPVGSNGSAQIELPIPVAPSRYAYFDVSLQEDNGDPTHSGVSVLRGPTSS